MLQVVVTDNAVRSPLILFNLKMKAIRSSKTSVLTRATRHHIPEDGILHNFINLPNPSGQTRPCGLLRLDKYEYRRQK
jgi:hypothetical protein